MLPILSVTATFADGVDRRVAFTTSFTTAVREWKKYRRRGFRACITDDSGADVSPQFFG